MKSKDGCGPRKQVRAERFDSDSDSDTDSDSDSGSGSARTSNRRSAAESAVDIPSACPCRQPHIRVSTRHPTVTIADRHHP